MELAHLPADFEFGVTSSAWSIEGAHDLAGRRPSIWDAVSAVPGRTVDGSTSATAVDHYHRYQEDVVLLAALGVHAYRFSISWSRVTPGGSDHGGAGLDFYDRLVDELQAPIVPMLSTDRRRSIGPVTDPMRAPLIVPPITINAYVIIL